MTDERLFELQLELEDQTPEQIRDRARATTVNLPNPELEAEGLRIFTALLHSPILTADQRTDRFTAWCEGAGVDRNEMLAAIRRHIDARRGDSKKRS